jgi:uncharacterized RDD family membrane protein YckC
VLDALPFLYLLGFLVVLLSGRRRQRIGDLAARTRVVRARLHESAETALVAENHRGAIHSPRSGSHEDRGER